MGKLLHKRIDYTGVSPYEFVPIKEADYNALTPAEQEDETKMYWLYDVDTVSADIDDESVSSGKVWSSEKVSSEINSTLEVKDFTFTAGPNCTIVVQDSFVFNKIVHLNVMLTVSTALATGAVLLTLPTGYTLKRRCDYQLHTGQSIAGAINGSTINANVGGTNTLAAGTYILAFDILLN